MTVFTAVCYAGHHSHCEELYGACKCSCHDPVEFQFSLAQMEAITFAVNSTIMELGRYIKSGDPFPPVIKRHYGVLCDMKNKEII